MSEQIEKHEDESARAARTRRSSRTTGITRSCTGSRRWRKRSRRLH